MGGPGVDKLHIVLLYPGFLTAVNGDPPKLRVSAQSSGVSVVVLTPYS